jgi:GT2 family glycosyltransferase
MGIPPLSETGETDISVVTAVLNAGTDLEACLESVSCQRGVKVEHVVIDGGSTDGSLQLLQDRKDPNLLWRSGPDKGIADAMNKGAALARGNWLFFLQADDRLLHDSSLADILRTDGSSNADLIAGGIRLGGRTILPEARGKVRGGWPAGTPFKQPFRHQGLLVSRRAWEQVGPYEDAFRITMDFDWMLRAFWMKLKVLRVGEELACVSDKGLSSARTGPVLSERLMEEHRARIRNAPGMPWRLLYRIFWIVYRPYRTTLNRLSAG